MVQAETPRGWEEIRKPLSPWISFGKEFDAFREIDYLEDLGINLKDCEIEILEVGFGYSRFLDSLVQLRGIPKSYTGIEINPFWVEEAKTKYPQEIYNFEFKTGDVRDKPLLVNLGRKFDLIVALEVFQYLAPTFEETLRDLNALSKEGGYLCFTIIERPRNQERIRKEYAFFERSYDPKEIKDSLERSGWIIVKSLRIYYRNGAHQRAFYLCSKGIPQESKEKYQDPARQIGMFLDSMNRVTGGHKRRVNIAAELNDRGWNTTLLVSRYSLSPRWVGMKNVPQERASLGKEKAFLFMGDYRWDFEKFCKAEAKKIWMFQGVFMKPPGGLVSLWRNPSIDLLTFTTFMRDYVKRIYGRAILAPGGVDPVFYCPPEKEKREKIVLLSSAHAWFPKEMKEDLYSRIKQKGWKVEYLSGSEIEVRKQYWGAGMVLSLRGDLEGNVIRDWNNPIAEGMATKTPAILMKAGGSRDIAIHKKTAYVVPVKNREEETLNVDVEEIKAGIDWMIDNPEERMEMAERALEHIRKFSYKKMVDIIEKEILLK